MKRKFNKSECYNYKEYKMSLFNPNKWGLSVYGDDAIYDLFGQNIVYCLLKGHSYYTQILFWFNKKLYLIDNKRFEYKMMYFLPDDIKNNNFWNRLSPRMSYADNGNKLYIYSLDSKCKLKYPINPVKEKLLYYWLKLNFYIKYLKNKNNGSR